MHHRVKAIYYKLSKQLLAAWFLFVLFLSVKYITILYYILNFMFKLSITLSIPHLKEIFNISLSKVHKEKSLL